MRYHLQLSATFFRSEYVPRASVFSGQPHPPYAWTWRWGRWWLTPFGKSALAAAVNGHPVRLPCWRAEVWGWRLRRALLAGFAMFFGLGGCLLMVTMATLLSTVTLLAIGGLLCSIALFALAYFLSEISRQRVFRIWPLPDGEELVIAWPATDAAVHAQFAQAYAEWRQAGSPLPEPPQEDSFAADVPPGWDEAGHGRRPDP